MLWGPLVLEAPHTPSTEFLRIHVKIPTWLKSYSLSLHSKFFASFLKFHNPFFSIIQHLLYTPSNNLCLLVKPELCQSHGSPTHLCRLHLQAMQSSSLLAALLPQRKWSSPVFCLAPKRRENLILGIYTDIPHSVFPLYIQNSISLVLLPLAQFPVFWASG